MFFKIRGLAKAQKSSIPWGRSLGIGGPIRQGGLVRGRLTGFRLTWERKTREEWAAVLDELSRTKLGRRARIRGTVEQVVGLEGWKAARA